MAGCGCGGKRSGLGSSGVEHIEAARRWYENAIRDADFVRKHPCDRTAAERTRSARRAFDKGEEHMDASGPQRTSPEGKRVSSLWIKAERAINTAEAKTAACPVSMSGVGRKRRRKRKR